MSYETISEKRRRVVDGLLADTSDIVKLDEEECVNYFNTLVLDELHKNISDLNCWIAGGSIRDYFTHGRHLGDIDIYFPDPQQMSQVRKFLSRRSGIIYQNVNCEKMHFYRDNSDLHDISSGISHQYPVVLDLIKIYSISPEVTLTNFDFTICAAAIHRGNFYCHKNFKGDVLEKKLSPISPNPYSILFRLQKFNKLGYHMSNDDLKTLTQRYIKDVT